MGKGGEFGGLVVFLLSLVFLSFFPFFLRVEVIPRFEVLKPGTSPDQMNPARARQP